MAIAQRIKASPELYEPILLRKKVDVNEIARVCGADAKTVKAYLDDEEELPERTPSPRLLRRDSSQIEGRSLNWVLGTVYNVLNLPRRLSAQALATATTNPLRP